MRVTVYKSALSGEVRAIPSKSDAHRKLICASLAEGETVLSSGASSMDIDATIRCLNALGAHIEKTQDGWSVNPIRNVAKGCVSLDCGESGSTLRFMLPLIPALGADAVTSASGRLSERPNGPLIDALCLNGARIKGETPPYGVSGCLSGGRYVLPGDISSQYFSGLLMALPRLGASSEIVCTTRLESSQYVDLTIGVMEQFGLRVMKRPSGYAVPAPQKYAPPGRLAVEGDWSNAAFFFAANAFGSNVKIKGLDENSLQPDRAIISALQQLGGEIDVSETPDLAPVLAAIATQFPGTTRIVNAARLRLKESDRLSATAEGLRALGANIEELQDALVIRGGAPLVGGKVFAHNDHRIAMAMAIAGTVSEGPVEIDGAEAVNKSYPRFFDDFAGLGGRIRVE